MHLKKLMNWTFKMGACKVYLKVDFLKMRSKKNIAFLGPYDRNPTQDSFRKNERHSFAHIIRLVQRGGQFQAWLGPGAY